MSTDMAFDNNDEYEVHAFFALGFWCPCGAELKLRTTAEIASDEWCAAAAREAREAGWWVPPAMSDGAMDIERCLCPEHR